MSLFNRAPDDWQTVIVAELGGHSPEVGPASRRVTVNLRQVPFRFSAHRNATQWIEIEGDDFSIWILQEVDQNIRWAKVKSSFLMKKSFLCGVCAAPLTGDFEPMQTWKFELQPPNHQPFQVEIEMPGEKCAACGHANALESLYADNLGEALGEAQYHGEN